MRLWPFKSEPGPSAVAEIPAKGADSFADVVEAVPEPLMVIRDGRIAFANAAARETFRLSADNPPLVTAIRQPDVLAIVEHCQGGGEAGEATFELNERAMRAFSRPLKPGEAVLVVQDETAARRSERMRADFLANASHELRTPLASLAGFIETLRGHAKDDPAARDRFLEIMAAQADRMGRLIDDLMSLSRIELTEHVPPQGLADLSQVAADVADALDPIAGRLGVVVAVGAGEAAMVQGDRDQLVQVVQNLVDNALKYSPARASVTVEVAADISEDEALAQRDPEAVRMSLLTPEHNPGARYVSLRVTDVGPGMVREHLPRLTERFYRTPGQKSGERLGTGLGLAIVKHIVNRHRGGLSVESAPGRGASFVVYLPAAAPAPAEDDA
jgi:two-component system, OmpR family, phosphate regulon sensor histidine kinase PhoR